MRSRAVVLACVAVAVLFSTTGVATADGCAYKGGENALPTSGSPVLVYANGDTAPSGFIGISDGSGDNYGQLSGDANGIRLEGQSSTAGQSGYANSSGETGSC